MSRIKIAEFDLFLLISKCSLEFLHDNKHKRRRKRETRRNKTQNEFKKICQLIVITKSKEILMRHF